MGLWNEYLAASGIAPDTPHDEWAFGGEDPDGLADLVLKGIKTGTASLYDCYVVEHEPTPKKGTYSVILDRQGKELCVIQDYSVRIVPFSTVDHFHAYTEGEGDRSLAYWQRVHKEFFAMSAEEDHIPLSEDPLVVLEKFRVVYPEALKTRFSLVQADEDTLSYVVAYKEAFEGRRQELHGTCGLGRREDWSDWMEESKRVSHPLYESNEDFVRSTQLFLYDEEKDTFVGAIHMRHDLNSNLLFSGGNIGYSVRPDERRKGYASTMLSLTLSYARALGLERVLITCNPENLGSKTTILHAGGVLENEVYDEEEGEPALRFWITL